MKRSMCFRTFALGLASIALALVTIGVTAEQANEPTTVESTATTEQPTVADRGLPVSIAGMQIYLDPETGRMRPPTVEEKAQLAAALRTTFGSKSGVGHSEPIQHKNGAYQSVVLDTSYLNFSIAHVDESGQVHADCVSSPEAAMAMIESAEAATANDQNPLE